MRRHASLCLLALLAVLAAAASRARADTDLDIPSAESVSTESIDTMPAPPSVEIAYQEITRNSDILAQLRSFQAQKNQALSDTDKRYQELRKLLEGALASLGAVAGKCGGATPTPVQKKHLDDARQALMALDRVVKGDPRQFLSKFDAKLLCDAKEGPAALGDEQNKVLLDAIAGMRALWVQLTQKQIQNAGKLQAAREGLGKRLQEASKHLQEEKASASNIVTDLKWLVLILAGLSVALLLVVRTYRPELQSEWVSSGQVIQYMTVLVILIAILALGLSGILKENTLGTLLGGIGGYVLSQGVGRAVARDVARRVQRDTSGPPPAAPG